MIKQPTLLDRIVQSLALLESEKGLKKISAEFQNNDDTRKVENRINRAFLSCLKDCFPKKRYRIFQELSIQPQNDTPYNKSEDARPDLTIIQIIDDDNLLEGGADFHIECKRLGSPTSSDNYNKLYVKKGIVRFTSQEFNYGINSPNGAMVGYIEDMEFDDIFTEVNETIDNHLKIESLSKVTDWQEKSTTQLNHTFERPFPKSSFKLHHFWIDLRGCYPRRLASCEIQSK
jgi:hypothetical protein